MSFFGFGAFLFPQYSLFLHSMARKQYFSFLSNTTPSKHLTRTQTPVVTDFKLLTILCTTYILIATASNVLAFPAFQLRIPNGGRVPHPCFPNSTLWPGVGHWRAEGSGERNPFGRDFAASQYQWTVELCKRDSDGDGRTNGEELGDPNCMWRQDIRAPPATRAFSHPGICEPVDASSCLQKNNYLSCGSATTFSLTGMRGTAPAGLGSCPAILSTDLRRFEMRLTGTATITGTRDGSVPHLCQSFALPSDQSYHLVAAEPIIDRLPAGSGVGITHIVVQACTDQRDMARLAAQGLNIPKSTCTLLSPCKQLAAVWKFDRIAQPNICLPDPVGIRFGQSRFSTIVVDIYYNYTNAWQSVNVESTGLAIFYTNKLRRYDGGLMLLGENIIEIPPGLPNYRVSAHLSSECSEIILARSKMNLYYASIHTNKLSQRVQLFVQTEDATSSVGLIDLQKEQTIQTEQLFAEKIGQLPISATNEIILNCFYDTRNKRSYTFYGDGSDDEMCITSIAFYPADNDTWFFDLTQTGTLSQCDASELLENCAYNYFTKTYAKTIRDLRDMCNGNDFPPATCLATCKSLLIDQDLVGHSCLNSSIFNKIARNLYNPPFSPFDTAAVLANVERCKMEIYSVALQQAGLYTQLNKTLAEKFGYKVSDQYCSSVSNDTSIIEILFFVGFVNLLYSLRINL